MLDKPPPDVPSSVVVGVEFALAPQALKLVITTNILVGEPALTVAALLTRVRWLHCISQNTVLFGFVIGVFLYGADRPPLEPAGVRDALTDVFASPRMQWQNSRDGGLPVQQLTVQVVFTPPSERVTDVLNSEVW